jgi:hypothetical protein
MLKWVFIVCNTKIYAFTGSLQCNLPADEFERQPEIISDKWQEKAAPMNILPSGIQEFDI